METSFANGVNVCYDVKYEGEFVLICDHEGKVTLSLQASLYKGAPEVVKKSGGCHMETIGEMEAIVINPKTLSYLTSINDYGWFVKDRVMRDNNLQICTQWRAIFVDGASGIVSLPARKLPNEIYVVPSIGAVAYAENRARLPMVPLLETLTCIHQEYSGMPLQQIGASVRGGFDPCFNDVVMLMRFLFDYYREELASLCKKENTPLHKLHQSAFNLTFGHNMARNISISDIRTKKQLENVYMVPLSRIFHPKTYGDIPWLIWDRHEKMAVEKKAKFITYPFGFFDADKHPYGDMKETIYFQHVCILPEIAVDGQHYPAGSIMGIVQYRGTLSGSEDTLLRGELFDGTTLREQIILSLMYVGFVKRTLTPTTDCTDIWKNFSFHNDQINVRKPFIKAIQATLFAGAHTPSPR